MLSYAGKIRLTEASDVRYTVYADVIFLHATDVVTALRDVDEAKSRSLGKIYHEQTRMFRVKEEGSAAKVCNFITLAGAMCMIMNSHRSDKTVLLKNLCDTFSITPSMNGNSFLAYVEKAE